MLDSQYVDDELSSEELVLQDLQRASEKVSQCDFTSQVHVFDTVDLLCCNLCFVLKIIIIRVLFLFFCFFAVN